jgi:hypothetical protein
LEIANFLKFSASYYNCWLSDESLRSHWWILTIIRSRKASPQEHKSACLTNQKMEVAAPKTDVDEPDPAVLILLKSIRRYTEVSKMCIGCMHTTEFWIEQVLFLSTSSALRSHNRVLYASMLLRGAEAMGWINPLIQGMIQNRTRNLWFPMITNLLLMLTMGDIVQWEGPDRYPDVCLGYCGEGNEGCGTEYG